MAGLDSYERRVRKMKKNRTAILKHLCACALTITMAFVVPSAGYAAGTDTLGFGAGGPGTNVDAYGNPVSGVVAKGITVSKYQYRASAVSGGIDWDTVKKSGVSFAMIRLGYYNDLDPNFVENMKGALAAGLKTGIFFYTQALDVDTARAEADFVLSQIKDYPISYPVAYDVESDTILQNGLTKQQITDQVKAFCERIAAAGYRPIVYANNEWLNNHLDMTQLPYDIWYARYGTVNEYPNRTIWQCTDHGEVPGIGGNVTVEYAFVDYDTLIPSDGWKQVGNDWYYVKNYIHQTGWLTVGDKTYYLGADGKMVHDTTVNLDGKEYTFGADGALQ